MGNLASTLTSIVGGAIRVDLLNAEKLTAQCALIDLPFELIHNVLAVWLSNNNNITKELVIMDMALCNRSLRQLLLQVYRTMNFELFLLGGSSQILEQKIKWSLTREINFTNVTLNEICDERTIGLFFNSNAKTLKAVHIKNNSEFNPAIAKIIAHCTNLEALSIEHSWICRSVANIINSSTLKRLRLREKKWNPVSYTLMIRSCCCPSLTELSIFDFIERKHTKHFTKAFPDVTELEIMYPKKGLHAGVIFKALFTAWKNLHTLKVRCMEEPTPKVFDALGMHCPNLTKLHLEECKLRGCDQMLVQLVERTTMLTCLIVDDSDESVLSSAAQVRIVQTMNTRLKELRIGSMRFDSALLLALAQYAPNLGTLELLGKNMDGYNSSNMAEVYRNCRNLQSLHLYVGDPYNQVYLNDDDNWVENFEDLPVGAHIVDIGSHCKNLHTLLFRSLYEFRVKDVHYLNEHCPKLASISTQ